MTSSRILTLAARYLRGHLRRYAFLLIAVSFGFAIITTTTALSDGMTSSVTRTARGHYAGDIFIMGIDAAHGRFHLVPSDAVSLVDEALKEAGLENATKVKRTNPKSGGLLYFNGNTSRQKYIYGIDWPVEAESLENMDFTAGGVSRSAEKNSILISKPIAESLGARLGDSIILQVRTLTGQINTGSFVITGIFNDPSIFGYYKCFVERTTLNAMLGLAPDEYSALGLYLPRRVKPEKAAENLYESLVSRLPSVPAIYDKEEFKREAAVKWEGIRYFVVPLKMYISEVDDLLVAMNITSYVVFAMIVLIVLVSVNVTYKLVINERIREIATLRAVGMPKKTVRAILMTEAAYLFILSLAGGLLLSGLLLSAASLISFSWIPGFEIFTRGGRLMGSIRLETLGLNALLLLAIVVPSALIPVMRASNLSLPRALSTG